MQSIMAGTAYEEASAVVVHQQEMQTVSSSLLLSDRDVGSRVHYEGRVLYDDPQPRDTTPRDITQSPRKRIRTDVEEPKVACDLLLADPTSPVLCHSLG